MAPASKPQAERRVRFLKEFWWSPPERGGRTSIRFLPGRVYFVRAICAKAAIESGAAVAVRKAGP